MLDLFAGAGGFSQAFSRAGFRIEGAVELDQSAAATFRANHGDVISAMGIREWLDEGDVPPVDVVVGGPPCQGFSTLGKQDPHDVRNKLWGEYVEVVLRAQPSYFVLENVGAFTRAPQYGALSAEVSPGGRLSEYDFVAAVLNAADYGTPQARKRTIFIGYRRGLMVPQMPEPTHSGQHVSVRRAFEERAVSASVETAPLPTRGSRRDGWGPYESRELHLDRTYSSVSKARFRSIPENGNRHDLPDHLKTPCWLNFDGGASDVMGRLRWDRPSVTIRTEFTKPEKGRYLHPIEDRAITLYEGALLQGFPDDYLWVGTRTQIAKQIGNAVPIQLGEAIARSIKEALDSRGDSPADRSATSLVEGHSDASPVQPVLELTYDPESLCTELPLQMRVLDSCERRG